MNSALIADVDASLSISVKENLLRFSVLVSNPLDGSNSTSLHFLLQNVTNLNRVYQGCEGHQRSSSLMVFQLLESTSSLLIHVFQYKLSLKGQSRSSLLITCLGLGSGARGLACWPHHPPATSEARRTQVEDH